MILFLSMLLSFTDLSSQAVEIKFSSEIGYQNKASVNPDNNFAASQSLGQSFVYAQPRVLISTEQSGIGDGPILTEFNASFRAGVQPQQESHSLSQRLNGEASVRSLSFSMSQSHWRGVAGFQEVPWGETFGFQILDIVNPRDYRDPLMIDPGWVRLPVAALQGQVFLGSLTLQGVLTPFPRSPQYIAGGSPFDPLKGQSGVNLKDQPVSPSSRISPEFGGRVSYLFDSGLDLGFLYFHHGSRTPVYEAQDFTGSPAFSYSLVPVQTQVDTFGTTLSYGWESLVLRADQALHTGQPLGGSQAGQVQVGTQWQGALGVDGSLEGESNWGLQIQGEVDRQKNENKILKWTGAKYSKSLWKRKLDFDLFTFVGLGNSDRWVQPQLKYHFNDSCSAFLRGDWVYSSGSMSEGYLWAVRRQSRMLLWLTFYV